MPTTKPRLPPMKKPALEVVPKIDRMIAADEKKKAMKGMRRKKKIKKVKPGNQNFIVVAGKWHMITKEEMEKMLLRTPRLKFLVCPP